MVKAFRPRNSFCRPRSSAPRFFRKKENAGDKSIPGKFYLAKNNSCFPSEVRVTLSFLSLEIIFLARGVST